MLENLITWTSKLRLQARHDFFSCIDVRIGFLFVTLYIAAAGRGPRDVWLSLLANVRRRDRGMKILSWNVNGLRKMGPLDALFKSLNADILCFQETRVSGEWDPHLESLAFVKGYYSFFSVCKEKRGYSGVATFCRKGVATPVDAGEGLRSNVGGVNLNASERGNYGVCRLNDCPCLGTGCPPESLLLMEDEGRCIITDHRRFVLINVYVPAVSVEGRVAFKMHFLHALEAKIIGLRNNGRHVIVVGDFNICPSRRDSAEPIPPSLLSSWEARPSRRWLRDLLNPSGFNFVDSFREAHPYAGSAYTCWSEATRARENNHGVRIDLVVMDRELFEMDFVAARIHADVKGSDHCPVSVDMTNANGTHPLPPEPPKFCTIYMSRFALRQSTLKDMLSNPASSKSDAGAALSQSQKSFRKSFTEKIPGMKKRPRRASSTVQKRKAQRAQATICTFFASQAQGQETRTVRSALGNPQSIDGPRGSSAGFLTSDSPGENHLEPRSDSNALKKRQETAAAWRKLLSGPAPPPLCRHGKPCVLKAVGKTGENRGRTFFSCPYPAGIGKNADCHFFQWAPFKAGTQTLPK